MLPDATNKVGVIVAHSGLAAIGQSEPVSPGRDPSLIDNRLLSLLITQLISVANGIMLHLGYI